MAKLLQNERVKLYKKPSTWVLSGILVGLMLFSVVFLKVITLLNSSYSYTPDWKQYYADEIRGYQQMLEETPEDTYTAQQIEFYRYLLEEEIPPDDWRTSAARAHFDARASAATAQQALTANPEDAEAAQTLEKYQKEAEAYKKVLDSGDWKAFLQLQIELIRQGESSYVTGGGETPTEREAIIEVLELQIELGIVPIGSGAGFYYETDSPDKWKETALNTLQSNKIALLRGEQTDNTMGESVPLTASARAKLEQENAVLLERLRTNTAPVEEDSFLGMLDSSAGNLNLITLLIMVLAGGIIAGEFGTGTVKLLLITPHRRQKIYWAKAVLLLELTAIITGAMFVLSFLFSAAFNGFAGIGQMQVMTLFGQVVRLPFLLVVVMKYLLVLLPVAAYGSLAFMLSAVTRKSAVAIAVSLIVMYGSQLAMQIVILGSVSLLGAPLPGLKFLLFANDNLSQYLPSTGSLLSQVTSQTSLSTWDTSMSLGFSVVILLVYTACFLWIGRDSFCRRDVK